MHCDKIRLTTSIRTLKDFVHTFGLKILDQGKSYFCLINQGNLTIKDIFV
jgi:hypothetical protein